MAGIDDGGDKAVEQFPTACVNESGLPTGSIVEIDKGAARWPFTDASI
jgi:hypothetical protein